MKRTAFTAVIVAILIFVMNIDIAQVNAANDAETMEIINEATVSSSVDFNQDGKTNILDLIQSKADKQNGQINISTDYLLGKSISKSTYDADILIIKRPLFEFHKLIDSNDLLINLDKVNEQNVMSFYNKAEQNFKQIKLDNQFGTENNYSQICDLDVPKNGNTATIAVNSEGKLGWTPDSFLESRNRNIDLDLMAAGEDNITFLKSLLSKRFKGRNVMVTGGVAEFIVYNDTRKITITSTKYSDNSNIDNWFYKFSSTTEDVVFSYDDTYKVHMYVNLK